MKIGIKLALVGILSLLVGSAFASPLLVTELDPENIKPYLKPPFDSFTSSVTGKVLYANFSITPNSEKESVVDLSYFVVINVTNTSNEPTNVSFVSFKAEVQDYSLPKTNSGGYSKVEAGRIWTAKEAWIDGKHYTVTWIPNKEGFDYEGNPELEGEWIEGVKIHEYYINYELTFTRINMNGTWVDVTGRIEVDRPLYWPPTENVMDAVIISHIKNLERETSFDTEGLDTPAIQRPPSGTSVEFDEVWAPHQSRLIVIKAERPAPSKYFEPEKLEKMTTEKILFSTIVQTWETIDNWTDSAVFKDNKQVSLELTDNGYLYTVLPYDPTFTLDYFGVEAFLEARD